jgi:hypothetical protein
MDCQAYIRSKFRSKLNEFEFLREERLPINGSLQTGYLSNRLIEPLAWLNTGLQATPNKSVVCAIVFRSAVVARKQIVFSAQGKWADGIFDTVVINLMSPV